MEDSFSLTLLWPGKSARREVVVKGTPSRRLLIQCVFIHLIEWHSVCINTHELEGYHFLLESRRLGSGRPKRKPCPVQAPVETRPGNGATSQSRYPDGYVSEHREASWPETEIATGKRGIELMPPVLPTAEDE